MIEHHRGALEAELIRCGLRLRDLGSRRFTWGDLSALLAHLAPDSPLLFEMFPEQREKALWGLKEHLLAGILDCLRWLVWANSKDGQRGRNRPEPMPRPGVGGQSARMRFDVMTIAEFKARKQAAKRPRRPIRERR